ncbi:MAG: B12-binding domain-containing radical SAM protein [Verrucomicrobia bacterium]|nr:B12-binding domain-containing radical SAM protein [Verrucomicrobiota bacterium]MBU1735449.1 B12-binding domain-containing radical SAM protein [Verrucomicrobiota bacterium]MBU1856844.1 B12-binding domain-containing radical SAM protein [Verrucomicrobiota bacterium]
MNILFVNPPQTVPVTERCLNIKFPLGLMYMADTLEKNGFTLKILDCPLHYRIRRSLNAQLDKIGLLPEQIKKTIEDFRPDIIGVSCAYSPYECDSFDIINYIKPLFRHIFIVVGGAHSSANPEYVLRNLNIDAVVIGEGEEVMLDIARRIRDHLSLNDTPGIALRTDNGVRVNERRGYIADLDTVKPAWHLLDMQQYFNHPYNANATMRCNTVDIVTSRGCPGHCVFCSIHTVWGRKWRARSPLNVVDEMEMLMTRYGARQIRIQDDNLTLDKRRIMAICDEIVKRKLDIRWDTPNGVAIGTLDKETLLKMKTSGCYRITFGIESGCKRIQRYIGKVLDLTRVNELMLCCHRVGMWVCATFIIGFPDETREEIRETENYILTCPVNFPFIYVAQPLKGTDLCHDFEKHNLKPAEFIETSSIMQTKYNTLHLTSTELNRIHSRLYKAFVVRKALSYLNPRKFYREMLSKIRSWEDVAYVLHMFLELLNFMIPATLVYRVGKIWKHGNRR